MVKGDDKGSDSINHEREIERWVMHLNDNGGIASDKQLAGTSNSNQKFDGISNKNLYISIEKYCTLLCSVESSLKELIINFRKLSINKEYANKFICNKNCNKNIVSKFTRSIFQKKNISPEKYFANSTKLSIDKKNKIEVNDLDKRKYLLNRLLSSLKELQDKDKLTFDLKINSYNSLTEIKNIIVSKCLKDLNPKDKSEILYYLIPRETIKQLLNYKLISKDFLNLRTKTKQMFFDEAFFATNEFNLFYWEFDEKRIELNKIKDYKESLQIIFNYLIQKRDVTKTMLKSEKKEFELILQLLQITDIFNIKTNIKTIKFKKYLDSENLLKELQYLEKLATYLQAKSSSTFIY